MSKIQRAGELFERNMENRGTISAKYRKQENYFSKIWNITSAIKYEEQGNYLSKIRRVGKLFEQNTESRVTI